MERKIVINKKGKKGYINRIITKSTGYVEVVFEDGKIGKEMLFNLKDEAGVLLKEKPISTTNPLNRKMSRGEKKRAKDREALIHYNTLSNFERLKRRIMHLNSITYCDGSASSQDWIECVAEIERVADKLNNAFIKGVAKTVLNYRHDNDKQISDKQAYVLAKFADESGIIIPDFPI